jgi:hypothetical protein
MGVAVQFDAFLNSALDGGEWSASRPSRFTPGERTPDTHCTGYSVGPRAGLEAVAKKKIPTTAPAGNRPQVVQSIDVRRHEEVPCLN